MMEYCIISKQPCHVLWMKIMKLIFSTEILLVLLVSLLLGSKPEEPTNPLPFQGAVIGGNKVTLCVDVFDEDGSSLQVSFYKKTSPKMFTIVALPDTQYYAQDYPELFIAQTQWIVENRDKLNIVFVTHLGDITDNGDGVGYEYQWKNAHEAISLLENAKSLSQPDGIPFGLCVGNHDNSFNARALDDEGGTTIQYNKKFGLTRFCKGLCEGSQDIECESDMDCPNWSACTQPKGKCREYFGGRFGFGDPSKYPINMDNHFELFSGGGMDFIAFHLEYDPIDNPTRQAVLAWMKDILVNLFPQRKAIITVHYLINTAGVWSNQGLAIWDVVKKTPNVFLMLCGHLMQAGRREDKADDGHTIYTLLSDYQFMPYGGRGWMRVISFYPDKSKIEVKTISPWMNYPELPKMEGEIDEHPDNIAGKDQNHFFLDFDMSKAEPFEKIAIVKDVQSGEKSCIEISGIEKGWFEWKVEVKDDEGKSESEQWEFLVECVTNQDCNDDNTCTEDKCVDDKGCVFEFVNVPCDDQDSCTMNDMCVLGTCQGNPVNCDDMSPCTEDLCDKENGCIHQKIANCCLSNEDCVEGEDCIDNKCVIIQEQVEFVAENTLEETLMDKGDEKHPFEDLFEEPSDMIFESKEDSQEQSGVIIEIDLDIIDLCEKEWQSEPLDMSEKSIPEEAGNMIKEVTDLTLDEEDTKRSEDGIRSKEGIEDLVQSRAKKGGGCNQGSSWGFASFLVLLLGFRQCLFHQRR